MGFDFVRMAATHRQLHDILIGRMAERNARSDCRETTAILLVCAELASIAHDDGDRLNQWLAISHIAGQMIRGNEGT